MSNIVSYFENRYEQFIGIEKGIVKGKIKTAENLLKMGMIIEQVAKATELPVEKITEIKKKMEN